MASENQAGFLRELQSRIDRYQPLLEREFGVRLGSVSAQPFVARDWLKRIHRKLERSVWAESQATRGRPPSRGKRWLLRAEWNLIRLPALAYLRFRHWYPDFMMRWDNSLPAVLVSFSGWSAADYERHLPQLDQWTVHELAHGVWIQLADDEDQSHGSRRWRWNEGFAHYLADIHLRAHYPPTATVDEDWSPPRLLGKKLVTAAVKQHGNDVLRTIPRDWARLDGEVRAV